MVRRIRGVVSPSFEAGCTIDRNSRTPRNGQNVWRRGRRRTMIHCGTLCIQRKVTKFPCFGGLVFRTQFQHFLSAFWRSFFFAMQLALVSMITITPTLSLSVFSLQRRRLFRTCGELWRTRGELWLYFEMQRRLDLWSFSWSSRRSREAQK